MKLSSLILNRAVQLRINQPAEFETQESCKLWLAGIIETPRAGLELWEKANSDPALDIDLTLEAA